MHIILDIKNYTLKIKRGAASKKGGWRKFQARPVIAVEDAVRVELEAIAWRDGLKERVR